MARHKTILPIDSHPAPFSWGVGSPNGSITATVKGESYVDFASPSTPVVWIAGAATDSDWAMASPPPPPLPFFAMQPIGDAVQLDQYRSIELPAGVDAGVDYGDIIIPPSWDGVADAKLVFHGLTPTSASGVVRMRVDYFVVTPGGSGWDSASYVEGIEVSVSPLDQQTYQEFSHASLSVPAAAVHVWDQVFFRLVRVGTSLSETHPSGLRVISGHVKF